MFFSFLQENMFAPKKSGIPRMFCVPEHTRSALAPQLVQAYTSLFKRLEYDPIASMESLKGN